jgi:hypothetical protein
MKILNLLQNQRKECFFMKFVFNTRPEFSSAFDVVNRERCNLARKMFAITRTFVTKFGFEYRF